MNSALSFLNIRAARSGPPGYPSRQRGFTIIELLVVVVVIGTLAALSFVAYSGMQNRAGVVATTANIRMYAQALDLYSLNHGNYIPTSQPACLGDFSSTDHICTSISTYEGSDCATYGFPVNETVTTTIDSSAFYEAIKPYMSGQPQKVQYKPTTNIINIGGCTITGTLDAPTYSVGGVVRVSADGKTANLVSGNTFGYDSAYMITYSIPGENASCVLPQSYRYEAGAITTPGLTVCMLAGGKIQYL